MAETAANPVDRIERWPLSRLTPYAGNPRAHSPEQIALIAKSFADSGQAQIVLVDEQGEIIAGHGRVLAAAQLGLADIGVAIATGWSEEQKRRYRIWDNQSALLSTWDLPLLKAEVAALAGGDLTLLGFDDLQLRRLTGRYDDKDPDAPAPEPPAKPITRPGDLWQLGEHRLRCGDATNAADVAALLADAQPRLMVTDPPYGVDYDADWRNRALRADGSAFGARATGKVQNDDRVDWREAWALFPGDVAYCWHADRHASTVQASLEAADFEIVCQVIWAKDRFVISRGDYHWQHEPCWYAVRRGSKHDWTGDRSQTTLWSIGHPKSETGHSAQKPVACMQRPLENNSRPGDAVYDPFVGSGTTIIAAELTARRCYALEIEPRYCDVTVQRWQNLTGKTAARKKKGGRGG